MSDCDKISFVKQTSEQSKHGQKQHFLPNCRSETPSQSVSPVMEQATSPIALRYWNYCLNRTEEGDRGRTPTNAPWKVSSLNNCDSSRCIKPSKSNEEPPTRRTQTPLPYISASPVRNLKQRARSESVPRTFRTLRITARVESPTPLVQSPPTDLKQSKSTSPVSEKPPTSRKKEVVQPPIELKESKSTSPVSERPPTPRKKKQKDQEVSNDNKLPSNEPESTLLANDLETCTKHKQGVNCDNGSRLENNNLYQSVMDGGLLTQDVKNR